MQKNIIGYGMKNLVEICVLAVKKKLRENGKVAFKSVLKGEMIMEFAKYYNVSDIVDNMIKNEEIDCYPTGEEKFDGVYVCMDTNDFWISRINKGYNEEYEEDENKYLVERNKISIYDVMDKLHEMYGKKLPEFKEDEIFYMQKNKVHDYLRKFSTLNIIKAVIILDDYDGLSNWDCCEADSLEEAIEIIDGGYGILRNDI